MIATRSISKVYMVQLGGLPVCGGRIRAFPLNRFSVCVLPIALRGDTAYITRACRLALTVSSQAECKVQALSAHVVIAVALKATRFLVSMT